MTATNPFYFNNETSFENEKKTMANILEEGINLHGNEIIWIPQELAHADETFGEFLGKAIVEGTPMRLFLEQVDTDFYNEDAALYTKFGLNLNLGGSSWHGSAKYFFDNGITPKPQDLIYYKKTSKLFEVTHIQLQHDIWYKISAILYDYDGTKIDTNVTEEDILTLDTILDKDQESNNDPIEEVDDDENIIDNTETDGLFS